MAHDQETIDPPDVHGGESDINVRAIVGFGAALFAVTMVVLAAIWMLYGYFDRREARAVREYPLATGEARLPPEPRLQVTPRDDLRALRAREDEILNSYTWVDREAGIVRIPIAEAMRLAIERGLPARPAREGESR